MPLRLFSSRGGVGGRFVNIPGDQASAALVGEVGPGPLEEDDEPISKADKEKNMNQEPGEPGKESGEF